MQLEVGVFRWSVPYGAAVPLSSLHGKDKLSHVYISELKDQTLTYICELLGLSFEKEAQSVLISCLMFSHHDVAYIYIQPKLSTNCGDSPTLILLII